MPAATRLRNAIVIVVDRLGSGFLGPYGNTWIETPAVNQLASESVLFENMIADSNDLAMAYRSYWTGVHSMCRTDSPECSLARLIERAGYHATLLTDDQQLLANPLADDFGEQVSLALEWPDQLADSIESTRLGQLTLAAFEWLADSQPTATADKPLAEPGLLWIHAQGMSGPWDAPTELAEAFRDEEDPLPYSGISPPSRKLGLDYDPDELLSVMHAYAAQVSLFDSCLGSLVDTISRHELTKDTLLIVTSPRGYPLGEHGYIGPGEADVFGESLQVPLLLRVPAQADICLRLDTLVQPTDIYATLARWFDLAPELASSTGKDLIALSRDESAWQREAAFAVGDSQRAARTKAWSLHLDAANKSSLYAKPDDRWEANEVADRCGEVATKLASVIDQFDELVNQGKQVSLEPLPSELSEGIG